MVSILLLKETPISCDDNCPCCEIEEGFWGDITIAKCRECNKNVIGYIGIKRPDWCPLRPLPRKEFYSCDHDLNNWALGRNYCIDEIMGELND